MLNQSVQPIDVDFTEVAENTGNLIDFPPATPRQPRKVAQQPQQVAERVARQPRKVARQPRKVAQQPNYTAAQLAEVAECTRQAWIKDWYRHFASIAPESDLRDGRKYKPLCMDLTKSLLSNKQAGMSTAAWVRYIGLPTWGQQRQEQEAVVEASKTVAIVPSSISDAQSAQALTLTRAQNLQGFAGALLDRLGEHLVAVSADATATNDAIADAAIVADEMAKILREQQLRAKIRADFEAKQQAAAAATLEQQLDGLKGGAQ